MSPTISGIAAPPRFTRYELAYLLAGRDDVSARTSRDVFGIPVVEQGDPALQAGVSSLVARGLIDLEQDSVLPRNEAGLVGFALGTATQWIALTVRVPEGLDLVVFVEAQGLGMMVRGAPELTLDFVPFQPGATAQSVARDSIARLLSRTDADLMIRVQGLSGAQKALFVRVRPEGLGIGHDPVFPGDENWPAEDLVIEDATLEQVQAAVDAVLASASSA